jgi:hypothetical protein
MSQVAYAGADDAKDELLTFLSQHSGGNACEAVNLGCDGYKLSCQFGQAATSLDKQLHYVVAPKLLSSAVDGDGLGVNGWAQVGSRHSAKHQLRPSVPSTNVANHWAAVIGLREGIGVRWRNTIYILFFP